MKDKRQRMAMAWPYGITDPNLYAYIMNAAASLSSYPYAAAAAASLPGTGQSPLNYYASLGLQRAAAAYSPYSFPSPLRPVPGPLGGSGGLLRPTATTGEPPSPSGLPCGLHVPREHPASGLTGSGSSSSTPSLLGGGHSAPCSAAPGENCPCPPAPLFYSGLAGVTTSLPAPLPVSHSLTSSTPHTTPSLFQPYKTDVERA